MFMTEEVVQEETMQEQEISVEETTEATLEQEATEEITEEAVELTETEQKLTAELEELNQRFLRVAADFDNFKRRTQQEKEDLAKYSTAKLIGELLPVLDNFELALKNPGESADAQNLHKGVEMIYRQLMQALEQAGMTKIEAVGQPFDPNLHEAIMQVPDDSVAEDTVVEELRAGYMLKDRVIRASMVKVSM